MGQDKFPAKDCVEAGRPMRARISGSWENDPFRACVTREKINGWIDGSDPCQERHNETAKQRN
jgi:hypothetical protein